MFIPHSVHRWLRLPSQFALLLGFGALSAAGAGADTPESHGSVRSDDLLVRSEGGKIYLSEGGREFQELQLGDTAEARYLKQLIEQDEAAAGSAGIRLSPVILASGGGSGFHWNPFEKSDTAGKARAPDQAGTHEKAATPENTGLPHKTNTTGADKKE